MLALIISGDFLFYIPCWLYCSVANFSYTSNAIFIFVPWVCLTHPVLPSFLCGEFLLPIPTCLHFYAGSFSYISYAGFLLCGEFLLHIPGWFLFYMGSLSYTSRSGFLFMWRVSLTPPVFFLFVFFGCEELLFSAVYSEDNPLRKELGGSRSMGNSMKKSHSNQRMKP